MRAIRIPIRTLAGALAFCLALSSLSVLAQDATDGTADGPATRNRVALVVGNGAYRYIPSLDNPTNDAKAVAEKLWEAGFEVIEVIDADHETMMAKIATFRSRLRKGSEALFYYAGHGVQIDGRNYLLPVSIAPTSLADLKAQSVDAQNLIDGMTGSGARLMVLIFDACRNNPFEAGDKATSQRIAGRAVTIKAENAGGVGDGLNEIARAGRSGLAEMSAGTTETIIGFATAPGDVASDGAGKHSPYTESLLQFIDEPGLEIGQFFRKVRGNVRTLTNGEQISWTTSTLEHQYFLRPHARNLRTVTSGMGSAVDTLGILPPQRVVDRAFWRAIKGSDQISAYRSYVRARPDGVFVSDALSRIRSLGGDPEEVTAQDPVLDHPELQEQKLVQAAVTDEDRADLASRASVSVPIGVDSALTVLTAEKGEWLHVSGAPELGVVKAGDGEPLEGGDVVWVEAGSRIVFQPAVGSNGGIERVRVAQLGDGGRREDVEETVEVFVHACDLLAGMPQDSRKVTAGARQFLLDRNFDAAISVCELAVRDHPDVPRFWAQLARAYRAAGRYEDALKWQRRAVDAGYLAAQINLGQMYLDAQAVPRDYAKARELFLDAAEKNETAAFTALGWIYRAGVGVEQDYQKAMEWYLRGADAGNDWAMTNIGEMHKTGKGVPADPSQAVFWYTRAAKSGELTAQTRLARMYQTGDGVPRDYELARYWFETAAGRGVPNALTRLGLMYAEGQGVRKSIESAVRLYGQAAREGDAEAFFRLGQLFAEKDIWFNDPERAAGLLQRAADAGVSGAHRALARLYEAGTGVPKDHRIAASLFEEAAKTNAWAARDLARLYTLDDGLPRDMAKAAKWYEDAARRGVSWAARDLGKLYEAGLGVDRDPIAAMIWYARALSLDDNRNLADLIGQSVAKADKKTVVAAIQTLLNRLGHDVGTPDGVAGPATRRAFSAAFESRGASFDGDPESFAALVSLSRLQ